MPALDDFDVDAVDVVLASGNGLEVTEGAATELVSVSTASDEEEMDGTPMSVAVVVSSGVGSYAVAVRRFSV